MSRLDDIIDYADEFGSIRADEARVELAAIRADLSTAQRERDEADLLLNKLNTEMAGFDEHHRRVHAAYEKVNQMLVELTKERDEARARMAALEAELVEEFMPIEAHDRVVDQMNNIVYELRDTNKALLAQLDEARQQSATLTPRRCLTCAQEAARKMRDACAEFVQEFDLLYEFSKRDRVLIFERDGKIAAAIRALPLADEFADCNPLKPEIEATR